MISGKDNPETAGLCQCAFAATTSAMSAPGPKSAKIDPIGPEFLETV
jgi:hypothetical protein